MTRESILVLLGFLIVLSPWSGLPLAWLEWVLLIFGLIIASIGFTLRSRATPPAAPHSPEPSLSPSPTLPSEPQPRSSRIALS